MGYTENDRAGLEFKLQKHKALLLMAKNEKAAEGIRKIIREVEEDIRGIS